MAIKLILTELRLLNLLFLAAFTLWGRHFVKSISSTVYNSSFLNKT